MITNRDEKDSFSFVITCHYIMLPGPEEFGGDLI